MRYSSQPHASTWHPRRSRRGKGDRFFSDVDGIEYVDFCLGDTGAMTGHSPEATYAAIKEQAAKGITLMLPTEDAIWVGEELQRRFGLKYWQDFGIIGAHSPALFWNDGPSIVKWLDAIPLEKMPRIWIDLGAGDEKEILDSANWFESQLTGRNIPHEWYLNTGEHDEKYWSSHVEQYLRWYARDW